MHSATDLCVDFVLNEEKNFLLHSNLTHDSFCWMNLILQLEIGDMKRGKAPSFSTREPTAPHDVDSPRASIPFPLWPSRQGGVCVPVDNYGAERTARSPQASYYDDKKFSIS